MEYRNTIVFKDTEYLATVKAITETLTVSLIDSKTESAYTGTFTSSNIEDLTSKTGNTKNFTVFCKLLVSSLQGKNPSLHLDFFSYQDLESIRKGSSFLSSSARPSKKKYLIISYITEFEKVHYPLALLLQDNENDKNHEVSKLTNEISYSKSPIDDFSREQTAKLKQENAFLSKKLSNFSDEFLAYKDRTDRKIEELTEIKHDLESEIQRMKEELDSIIVQLEEDAKKKAHTGNGNDIRYLKQNLAREKEENGLLKEKLATCSKEIEVLRGSDQGNKKIIEMLSRKMEEADEKSLESNEPPQRSPFKFSDSESQGNKNCLNELGSNLTRVQYLLKKHKS